MNLYDLLHDPEKSPTFKKAYENVPIILWNKYKEDDNALQKRAHIFARDPETAYRYARFFADGRWPEGEDAIASDPKFAHAVHKK